MKKLEQLKTHLHEIQDLSYVSAVLNWDQNTMMPNGGATGRGRQSALITRMIHERWTDDALGYLIDDLLPVAEDLNYDSDDAAYIRVAKREFDRRSKIPTSFTEAMSKHQSESFQVWRKARYDNDFAAVQPYLEKTLEFSRQQAEFYDGYDHFADPLISERNEGLTVAIVRELFGELRTELVNLLDKIRNGAEVDNSCLYGDFPRDKQYAFAMEAIQAFGWSTEQGRLDEAPHPFSTALAEEDGRITTRAKDNHLGDGVFATMHEAGHSMYSMGVRNELARTIMVRGASSSVHESQSRLWENRVGRSREFWVHYYPRLREYFPQFNDVDLDTFYAAINKVQPSLLRVSADEVTYNLHIMIRTDLEIDMLEGNLAVKDLPDAWNARYESDLGITPPDDTDGVMQDIHWYAFRIGGSFVSYTMGNILGAQYWNSMLNDYPDMPQQVERGEFDKLNGWLSEHVWQHGGKYNTVELTERITGGGIEVQPLVDYLNTKFGAIYKF